MKPHRAVVGPGYLQVAHPTSLAKGAPPIDTNGVLPAEEEAAVFAHHELPHQPGASGERQLARR